jgi:hypothetical protein
MTSAASSAAHAWKNASMVYMKATTGIRKWYILKDVSRAAMGVENSAHPKQSRILATQKNKLHAAAAQVKRATLKAAVADYLV